MNKKLKRILLIVYVLILVVMLSSATYAYFALIQVSTVTPQIKTQAATTEWLIFSAGEPINILANEDNFGALMGNLSDATEGSVLLKANNLNEPVSHNYMIYLEIAENEFTYTTQEKTSELLLSVTNPDGNIVTQIDGLEYVTVIDGEGNEISGFDITNALGRYYFAYNYEISTDSEEEDIWNVEVTLVNLDSNQQGNTGKSLNGILRLEQVL